MQVYIAGVHHYDPLCKTRLRDWLQHLLDTQPTHPSFVAVEWNEDLFSQVKLQRPTLRRLAASRWSQSTAEFLDALEATLAFDADTHNLLMPNIQTVWLDDGRSIPSIIIIDIIKNFASNCLKVYESYIPAKTTNFDSRLLNTMSLTAWNRSDGEGESATNRNRDAKFAETIIKHLASEESAWAIVVVGYYHARRETDWMAYRLEAAGINCIITELRP